MAQFSPQPPVFPLVPWSHCSKPQTCPDAQNLSNVQVKPFPPSTMSFSSIPVLDLSLARDPQTKSAFLESLRNALLDVGFLYIKNTGIDDALIQDVIEQGKNFFDLPEGKKLEVQMKNKPSFLGTTFALPKSHYPTNITTYRLQQAWP